MQIFFTGLHKIQNWTKQSLITRLKKSLSHDWIHESVSHKFPLREYYVQLEWEKKSRTAMGSNTEVLTSIHELIKQLTLSDSDAESLSAGAHLPKCDHPSVIIEGKTKCQPTLNTRKSITHLYFSKLQLRIYILVNLYLCHRNP